MTPGTAHSEKASAVIAAALAVSPRPDVPLIVDTLMDEAIQAGASDLHLTPTESGIKAQIRRDGVVHRLRELPATVAAPIVSRIKVLAGLLTYRTEIPQEGRIPPSDSPRRPEVRVSTFPTLHGERAALRFLTSELRREKLQTLGLDSAQIDSLRTHLSNTSGMVVITGPAGAGKTTTFYACLREIVSRSDDSRCVVSLEDPVESAISGIVQTGLDSRAGLNLARLVKSVMRQDPDVIGIGEIRDRATARAAFQATLTGHLVVSTIHAGDGVEVLTRLMDMRIPSYVIRSGLKCIVAQRLLRRLCPECRVEVRLADDPDQALGFTGIDHWYDRCESGCPACHGTGYQGRIMIAQLLDTSHESIAQAISQKADSTTIRALCAGQKMPTLLDHAIHKIKAGETSPVEVRRVLGFA